MAEFLASQALARGIGRRSLVAQRKLWPSKTGRQLSHAFSKCMDPEQLPRLRAGYVRQAQHFGVRLRRPYKCLNFGGGSML